MGTFLLKTPNSAKSQMSDFVEQYRNIENLSSAYGLNVNLPAGYMDNLELQKQLKFSMQSAQPQILNSSSFKIDDILNTSSTSVSRKAETNASNNARLAKSETNSNSSALSVSSYCSSVASSLPSPYQSTVKSQDSGLPMHASNNSQNSTEFLLNHANSLFMPNPFMNIGNAQG